MRALDCEGLMELSAGLALGRLAAKVPADEVCVEIGVYRARSLLFIAEGAAAGCRAEVVGIDPWDLDRPSKAKYKSHETYAYAQAAVAASPAGSLIRLEKNYSLDAAASWAGPKIGLLHVDSDHRYGPVLADFHAWKKHLAPGARLAWDDYHTDFPGVITAVNQLYKRGEITRPALAEECSRLAVARWLG